MIAHEEMEGAAVLSDCGTYRYTLERHWDRSKGHALFVLLNPSKADAKEWDPTLRKGVGFSDRWGYGGVVFVNLFAFRATDPMELKKAFYAGRNVVGPENDSHILAQATRLARVVVCAWGTRGNFLNRDLEVFRLLKGTELWCLGRTQDGHPNHPLYQPYERVLQRFPNPKDGP